MNSETIKETVKECEFQADTFRGMKRYKVVQREAVVGHVRKVGSQWAYVAQCRRSAKLYKTRGAAVGALLK
jgi:hypothetical protein